MRGEIAETLNDLVGNPKLKNQAKTKIMNKSLDNVRDTLFNMLEDNYKNTSDYPKLTAGAFLIYYCWIIVSVECRNYLWNYESMDLSRRSGELWESLVKQCWTYPVYNSVRRFQAPDFVDVSTQIQQAFKQKLIDKGIEQEILQEIFSDYSRIWSILGDSINLNSDELFETTFRELAESTARGTENKDKKFIVDFKGSYGSNEKENKERLLTVADTSYGELAEITAQETESEDKKFIIDFKGSYGSNEKGNKERLLTVARVYDLLNHYKLTNKPYTCILAVRTIEDQGGHNYLRQLENSGLWTVKRGNEVYEMVHNYTGFNVLEFINSKELSIMNDLDENTAKYMKSKITSKLGKTFADHYLTWW